MYFDYICKINKAICNNEFELRYTDCFGIFDKYINIACNEIEGHWILYNSMKVCALIKLYQPFYDGNHRTALIVFGDLISSKGFTFDYVSALNDMANRKLNIPTIYSE